MPEQQQHPTPFRVFPCRKRLDKKCVRHDRSKPAQGRDESELSDFFAKIEIEFDAAEMFLSMKRRQVAFNWQFERADRDQYSQHGYGPHHNSFP